MLNSKKGTLLDWLCFDCICFIGYWGQVTVWLWHFRCISGSLGQEWHVRLWNRQWSLQNHWGQWGYHLSAPEAADQSFSFQCAVHIRSINLPAHRHWVQWAVAPTDWEIHVLSQGITIICKEVADLNAQFKKGVLELVVLISLAKNDMYSRCSNRLRNSCFVTGNHTP